MGKSDYGIGKDGNGGCLAKALNLSFMPSQGTSFPLFSRYSLFVLFIYLGVGAQGAQARQPVYFLSFHFWIVKLFF